MAKLRKKKHMGEFGMMNIFFSQIRNQKGKSKAFNSQALKPSLSQQLCHGCISWSSLLYQTQVTQSAIDRARLDEVLLNPSPTLFPTPPDSEIHKIFYVHRTRALF